MGSRGSGRFMANNFGLVFGGIWLLVGLPFLAVAILQWQSFQRFDEGAVRAQGTVFEKAIKGAERDRRSRTEYSVRYRFTTPDGQTVEGRSVVDVEVWESLTEQGPVEIEYLPEDPANSRVAGQADWVILLVFGILGGVFTIAGGLIFAISLKGRLARNWLRQHGQPTAATVFKLEETNMSINRVRQWRIVYRYLDMYGVEHLGKSGFLSPQEAQHWQEGDIGQAYHDPQKPEKSVWGGRPGDR